VTDLITICIPTYRRPTFLLQCVYSCLAQDYRPLEIDISDNSPNPETEEWVKTVPLPEGVSIRYWRNPPSTGPVESFNKLLNAAEGRRLVFMNDDDVLLAGAVTAMSEAFELAPDVIVCYGREQIINTEGEVLHETTAQWEMKYRRESDQTGLRRDLLVCAFWQQISHVGFLILTEAARKVGFRDRSEVGLAVDTDFGIRLAQAYRGSAHVFIDRFTIQSRIGPSTLGRKSRDAAWKLYDSIRTIDNLSQEEALALDCLLKRLQPLAFREYSLAHGRLAALRLFLSRPYRSSGDLARWAYTLSLVMSPNLVWWIRHLYGRPWARAKERFAGG
jgi:glycosyltransferase involved in cell wall biosynthesis